MNNQETGLEIAVIGMSGRYPESDTLAQFWNNLVTGKNSFTHFSEEELKENGVTQEEYNNKDYIKVKPFLDNVFDFDAELFGYTSWEAEYMDPQIKLFHECVYHALEDAGYDAEQYDGRIGLYSGASMDLQWLKCLLMSQKKMNNNILETSVVSSKDFISQLISYNMNLTGPSVSISSACSTALTSIHTACSGLLLGDCHMAVAGGVTINQPSKSGYEYCEGSIYSKDGRLRPYDEEACGTVFGEGGGAVVLKRLSDAIEDNDHIYAVIRATACNNDGSRKVGFTAPSVEGQKELIQTAFEMGEVDPSSIQIIEGHGTGTNVGDPIEVEALKQAFDTEEKQICALGSVKGNIGHLNAGAGVASFMKAALALKHEVIPPASQYDVPNRKMKIEETPFYINKEPVPMVRKGAPLRAGISSFGVGGTNVHMILQEAPKVEGSAERKEGGVLLQLSAKTEKALTEMTHNLHDYLLQDDKNSLQDVAFTLATGRKQYKYHASFVAADREEAIAILSDDVQSGNFTYVKKSSQSSVAFQFSDSDRETFHQETAKKIYEEEAFIKQEIDRLAEKMLPLLNLDIRTLFDGKTESHALDSRAKCAQVFAMEYAQAKFLQKLGIRPDHVIGQGLGEYTAAAFVGVMSEEEVIRLITEMASSLNRENRDEIAWAGTKVTFSQNASDMARLQKDYLILNLAQEAGKEEDTFIRKLDFLMKSGYSINWKTYYEEKDCYRVSLPGYPFQRKCFYPDFLKYLNASMADILDSESMADKEKTEYVFDRPETDENSYLAPETEADKIICEVVSEVLSMKRVGMKDDFFWLGAHSLLITKIIAKLKEIFRTEIPLDEVMEEPTIEMIHKILVKSWGDEETLSQIAQAYREYQQMIIE